MPVLPLVQFKAGICEIQESARPWKVKPKSTQGFIYLYREEDLTHFCWRPRAAPLDDAGDDAVDLIMFPGDGNFEPWQPTSNPSSGDNIVLNGRIYKLGFQSSSAKHFFWLQSKSDDTSASADQWSERDYALGRIVNEILKGEDHVDAQGMYQSAIRRRSSRRRDNHDDEDGDAEMRDPDRGGSGSSGAGGAGSGATGGDINDEGEEPRQGGEDGARATEPRSATGDMPSRSGMQANIDRILRSLRDNPNLGGRGPLSQPRTQLFTTLPELLTPETTLDILHGTDGNILDDLLADLPSNILSSFERRNPLQTTSAPVLPEPSDSTRNTDRKREAITRVLRSPQFTQSLAGLTSALRDGGLPTISEALKVDIDNGGFVRGESVPLGGGAAVEAFLEGVKRSVERAFLDPEDNKMETDQHQN